MATDLPPTVKHVNHYDLDGALILATVPIATQWDETRGWPWFLNQVFPGPARNAHHSAYSAGHVTGRWLDALAALDEVGLGAGHANLALVDKLASFQDFGLHELTGLPLCLNTSTLRPIPVVDLHNVRETLLGLLARHRFGDARAIDLAVKVCNTVNNYLDDSGLRWDECRFHADTGLRTFASPFVELERFGIGRSEWDEGQYLPRNWLRAVDPISQLDHDLTEPAVSALLRKCDIAIRFVMLEASGYEERIHGPHMHSVTSTLAGYAAHASRQGSSELVVECVSAADRLLAGRLSMPHGWVVENSRRLDDMGEANSTADLALLLAIAGSNTGDAVYWRRLQLILSSHLLPAQVRDARFVGEAAETYIGAFGFPSPFGHLGVGDRPISFNWDIVGGVLANLARIRSLAVSVSEERLEIRLLAQMKTHLYSVEIAELEEALLVTVENAASVPLLLRVPAPGSSQNLNGGQVEILCGPGEQMREIVPSATESTLWRHPILGFLDITLRDFAIDSVAPWFAPLAFFPHSPSTAGPRR